MTLSLITNSGIQVHKFTLRIDPNAEVIGTMGFYENVDNIRAKISLEHAFYLPDQDCWVPKQLLKLHDYLDEKGYLKEGINYNLIKPFKLIEDKNFFTVSDIFTCLEYFCSTDEKALWLPIPYFKKDNTTKNSFGPISWARMMIKEVTRKNPELKTNSSFRREKGKDYHIVIAFDTNISNHQDVYFAPSDRDTLDGENLFSLCQNEDLLLNFCNAQYNCDWVANYLKRIVLDGNEPTQFPHLKYLAYYIYFIKYLSEVTLFDEKKGGYLAFPEVTLYSDQVTPIEVDLVLDIGNSNTCGILFERPSKHRPFSFKNVKKLKINDLSMPEKDYDDPFSMRLVFVDTKFGYLDIPEHKNFKWPSILRIGQEANRLINKRTTNQGNSTETVTHHSSPKRYLWDTKKAEYPWEFINFSGKNIKEAIYYEGVSEQFKEDGEFALDGVFSFSPYYSRKSLMTFVFMEILLHAISQINSHAFRNEHGSIETPRKIKRITITCPTSIIQKEQVVLRECAETAVRALQRFFSDTFLGSFIDEEKIGGDLEIIPSPKDLARKRDQVAFRKDWIYDEATCAQLVFLYGEISKRYLNKAETFFDLYGRLREDVSYPDKKSLTIGSIDIGGGTTDLMICAYQNEPGQNLAVLKPQPIYWESFNFAGDDLLKDIIQQILIEGSINKKEDIGCVGVLTNAAKNAGVVDVNEKILRFFGPDNAKQNYLDRIRRKNFVVQIAIPIALRYLQHTIDDKLDEEIAFYDFFPDVKPNPELIRAINDFMGANFKIETLSFKLSKRRVSEIVEQTFDALFRQLSGILSAYGCDFLLLAGKPTTLPKVREIFVRYYPVSPERIISLSKNKYRIGRWYPFADDLGYIEDPKTIVSVGAIIALMGGKLDNLDGFRLNTQPLRQQLGATSDYIGTLDQYTHLIDDCFITPDIHIGEIEVHSLPIKLGYKQLPNKYYRGRPIYKLEFNDNEIKKLVKEQNSLLTDNSKDLDNAIQEYKVLLKNSMPFKVKIQRNWSESKEHLSIIRLLDSSRKERSKQLLSLTIMTLAEEYSYWLDSGEFVLNLR
ncbi:virulence factor SrfB [Runella sp. SP2]|uniref:virulence factor SrfB n=1 Tax=Runella sp. SP2 TaxID=2268026 RepID=UPI0013DDCD8B|nr:virulence factor SrfB [Runella sp. SP2]